MTACSTVSPTKGEPESFTVEGEGTTACSSASTTKQKPGVYTVEELVAEHDDLEYTEDGEKVKCISTGHEMPFRFKDISDYINGAGYRKKRDYDATDFTKYAPHIVPSEKLGKHMFCTLTGRSIPMNPQKIEKHMESKRFKSLVKKFEEHNAEMQRRKKRKLTVTKTTRPKELKEEEGENAAKTTKKTKKRKIGENEAKQVGSTTTGTEATQPKKKKKMKAPTKEG